MTKRTLGGTNLKLIRVSGFRKRIQTKNGRKTIRNRRSKGRKQLTVQYKFK